MKTLTAKEVADFLKVNYETVLRMIRRGEIKATKIGGKIYRITEEDFKNYMKVEVTDTWES